MKTDQLFHGGRLKSRCHLTLKFQKELPLFQVREINPIPYPFNGGIPDCPTSVQAASHKSIQ